MRTAFHDQLDGLTALVGDMCGLAGEAMARATQALLQADLVLAEHVITDHDRLARMKVQAEETAFVLLALQSPVAGDLRAVVSSMQNVADAERMGGLALHIAKIARRRHPSHALPDEVNAYFAKMGKVAVDLGKLPGRSCCRPTWTGQPRSRVTTTQWTACTRTCSPCCWTRSGSTASPQRST